VRRYNAQWKNNRKCSGMHTKCHGYGNHGNLGDTYGCNAPGQRDISGHMWFNYYGNAGLPGASYSEYNNYGSRWIM